MQAPSSSGGSSVGCALPMPLIRGSAACDKNTVFSALSDPKIHPHIANQPLPKKATVYQFPVEGEMTPSIVTNANPMGSNKPAHPSTRGLVLLTDTAVQQRGAATESRPNFGSGIASSGRLVHPSMVLCNVSRGSSQQHLIRHPSQIAQCSDSNVFAATPQFHHSPSEAGRAVLSLSRPNSDDALRQHTASSTSDQRGTSDSKGHPSTLNSGSLFPIGLRGFSGLSRLLKPISVGADSALLNPTSTSSALKQVSPPTQYELRRRRLLKQRKDTRIKMGSKAQRSGSTSDDCLTWSESSSSSTAEEAMATKDRPWANRLLYHLARQAAEDLVSLGEDSKVAQDTLRGASCPSQKLKTLVAERFPLWAPPTFVATCIEEPVPFNLYEAPEKPSGTATGQSGSDADEDEVPTVSCNSRVRRGSSDSASSFSQSESDDMHSFSSSGGAPKCHSSFLPLPVGADAHTCQSPNHAKTAKLRHNGEGDSDTAYSTEEEGNTHSNPMCNESNTSNSASARGGSKREGNCRSPKPNVYRSSYHASHSPSTRVDGFSTDTATLNHQSENLSDGSQQEIYSRSNSANKISQHVMPVRGLFARTQQLGFQQRTSETFVTSELDCDSDLSEGASDSTLGAAAVNGGVAHPNASTKFLSKFKMPVVQPAGTDTAPQIDTNSTQQQECFCRSCVEYAWQPLEPSMLLLGKEMGAPLEMGDMAVAPCGVRSIHSTLLIGPSMTVPMMQAKTSERQAKKYVTLEQRGCTGYQVGSSSGSSSSLDASLPMPIIIGR